jgi:hypothetical protein
MIGRNHKLILISIISAMSLCLASCGYHFSGEGDGPKPGLRCIAIPVFENKTTEPDAGAIFAGALRQEFMRRGNMKVVPIEEAEAVFKGTIKSISVLSAAHNPVGVVSNRITVESRITVVLDIRCEEKKSHKTLWSDPYLSYYKIYEVNNSSLQTQPISGFENRENALDFLAQEMSTRIHDRFLSNF